MNKLRSPDTVMKLDRLGAFHQTRLSFVRSLLRKVMAEQWQITRIRWELDENGFGTAIYRVIATAGELYNVVFFANDLPDDQRTDRVIAQAWDVAFVLCAGDVTTAQVAELRQNVPKQEAGRYLPYVLVLSRANKSTRNFSYVVDSLSRGVQPDPTRLGKVGYLYRTTAVYGNGKFGIADFDRLRDTEAFEVTFRAQMFCVWMMRHFSIDQLHHLVAQQGDARAITLAPDIQRYLGVGNATGLGMAPFLVSHPILLNQWIATRETAIALVVAEGRPTEPLWQRFLALVQQARQHVYEIETIHALQQQRNQTMLAELTAFVEQHGAVACPLTWQAVLGWVAEWSAEGQEVIHSILLELYPDLINPLAEQLNVIEDVKLDPAMPLAELWRLVQQNYGWALAIDYEQRPHSARFWYRSANKEEPRLGSRYEESGAEKERPLGIGRDVYRLHQMVAAQLADDADATVIDLLLRHPDQRGIIRRVQSLVGRPYSEIRDNLIGVDCLPIHMLRCKLSFFGASKFDPRSNLWVRITLFQGAPLVGQIGDPFADDWFWPIVPSV